MSDNLRYYMLYSVLYGIILLAGEAMYRYLKVKPERSRNFSHLAAGLASLPYPWLFSSHWWVLLIALQSSIILYLTRRYGFIPSHHKSAGKALGSFLFFASIYICFLVSDYSGNQSLFVIPILVLAISDVSASLIGQKYGREPILLMKYFGVMNKTRAGSIAFFCSSLLLVFGAYYYFLPTGLLHAALIALVIALGASLSEALSPNGFDNLSVPITILIIMWLNAGV